MTKPAAEVAREILLLVTDCIPADALNKATKVLTTYAAQEREEERAACEAIAESCIGVEGAGDVIVSAIRSREGKEGEK